MLSAYKILGMQCKRNIFKFFARIIKFRVDALCIQNFGDAVQEKHFQI